MALTDLLPPDPSAPNPAIAAFKSRQAGLAPINGPSMMSGQGMASGAPVLPQTLRPLVTSPRVQQENDLQSKINAYENPAKPKGFWHNLRHIAAVAGNVAGDIVAPSAMALIPGTQLNRQIQHNENIGQLAGLQRQDEEESNAFSEETLRGAQTDEAEARAAALRAPKEDKPDKYTIQATDHGLVRIDNVTGEVSPVTFNGKPLNPFQKPNEKPDTPEQQYLDEYSRLHPGATVAEAERHYALDTQRPPQIAPVMMMVPNPQGGATATVVRPGQAVAPGAVTASGYSGESVSANKTAQADTKAKQDAQKEYQLAQTLVANPSPTNDLALVMRYIGATKPDSLGKLRLNNNEIDLVMGTRNTLGDLEAMAEKVRNGQKLTPQQRQDMLKTMKILANGGQEASGSIFARDPQGKLHQAPAGTPLPEGWKEEKR